MTQGIQAILAGLSTRDGSQRVDDAALDELEALLETAGGRALGRVFQTRDAPDVRTFFGAGKAEELGELARAMGADAVVLDNELSPSQTRHLEAAVGVPVLDRSLLILDIFADRAHSAEGRVQVELARLKYILPRLAGQGVALSRQGGGGAGGGGARRGAGETKLESDRRHIRARIDRLTQEIEVIRRKRGVQRQSRQKGAVPSAALIGYTNSGKSTLLNALCRESLPARDRLFDTLDTTTRRWQVDITSTVLLTDTVGFIRKLPHHLIEAFKATLEELTYADVLLHVVDASSPEWPGQVEVVDELVTRLGAAAAPCIRVYNKCDAASPETLGDLGGGVSVSARTGEGLDKLAAEVKRQLACSG